MSVRCPYSKPKGKFNLPNYELVFRGVADIKKSEGCFVPVGVWDIDSKDEKALDRYEGYPHLYTKKYLTIKTNGKRHVCMFYVMNDEPIVYKPSDNYFRSIFEGYQDFDIDTKPLMNAYKSSLDNSAEFNYNYSS